MNREFIRGPMRTGLVWVSGACLAMLLIVLAPGAGLSLAPVSHGDEQAAGLVSSTTDYALNWAGYVATGSDGSVTSVAGTWVVPTITCSSSQTDLSVWVGIDGFNTKDLIQAGTGAACNGGSASYDAWWEVLPAPETIISSITVHPGDTVTASVTYSTSTEKFTMTIADGSHSFSKTKKVSPAARDAAVCIVERPEVGGSLSSLAKFKTATFSSCTATISGATHGIGGFPGVKVDMVNTADTKIIASTSALKTESSFTVTWKGYT